VRISDWSSDVCSSDLFGSDERAAHDRIEVDKAAFAHEAVEKGLADTIARGETPQRGDLIGCIMIDAGLRISREAITKKRKQPFERLRFGGMVMSPEGMETIIGPHAVQIRSEEHTSELQSLMRISYAVFCLKKKKQPINNNKNSRQ